jgi:phage tail-like protein
MPTGDRNDPFFSYNFIVEIDGVSRGVFQEASGFDSTVEVIEYRQGGENLTTRKLPGRTSFSNITLKRGVTDDSELYEWHQSIVDGNIDRRSGSIVLLSRDGSELTRWNFFSAWPTKYTAPDFNAEGNEVAIETLELAHEGLRRVT